MKKYLIVITLCLLGAAAEAQTAQPDTTVYTKADKTASFPGGIQQFYKYLSKNLKMQRDQTGKVYLRFIVEKDGTITNPIVWKSARPEIDAEALRVIKKMPKWEPALISGNAIRQLYTVPINFN